MKNLPIRNETKALLEEEYGYPGVWKVKGKEGYIKLTSKLGNAPVRIFYNKSNKKQALEEVLVCAKLYKRLIEEGVYHPEMSIAVCEDDCNNLALLVCMPRLEIPYYHADKPKEREAFGRMVTKRKSELEKKLGFKLSGDFNCDFNWGVDKETRKCYFHDLDIHVTYIKLLEYAEALGIK